MPPTLSLFLTTFCSASLYLAANFENRAPFSTVTSSVGRTKSLNNMLQLKLFTASVLLQVASGFRVDFWGGVQCTGSALGTWIGGPHQGCHRLFVGEAEGVTVESTGPVDDNTVVVFYSSSTCDLGTAIAESNAGCISVDDFFSAYKSFNVIQSNTGSKRRGKRWANSSSVATNPSAATNPSTATNPSAANATSFADLREQSDRLVASTHALARQHGVISDYQGQSYKWQQVAEGAWRGIAPGDWDDSIHIKNDTVIKYSETYPTDFSKSSPNTALSLYDPSDLSERAFLFGTCGAVRVCALAVAEATSYSCSVVGRAFINKVSQLATSAASVTASELWEFLNQPVVVGLTVNVAGEAIGGVVGAVTSAKLQASSCSSSGTDADTLSSMLALFPGDRAGQVIVNFRGVTGTFSFEAVPSTQRGDGNTCGAPATDPTTTKVPRALTFRA